MYTVCILYVIYFGCKSDTSISEEDMYPPQASEAPAGRSFIKVDIFSVTLHERADELAFTLIK